MFLCCVRYLVCFIVFFFSSHPTHANKSGVEPSVLSLPQGPGSLGGIGENVQANLNMGLMSYEIKVVVPKGRGAATPDPSITYSSSAGSGIVGVGWSFSAGGSIERATVRGLPTYTNNDLFYAGGEIVKIPNTPFYRNRYEGSFVRYRWVQKDPNDQRGYWIAESPDGSKMYYGANEKGELDLDAQVYGLKGTFRWELVAFVDRNGNRVAYTYFKDGAQTYPDQIAWVFDDSEKPLYHLKFGYEERPDHVSDGKPGFDLRLTKRLKEVQITSNGQRFRSYHLAFEDATGLSRLVQVTRYGRDPAQAYPIQFSMKYSDATFSQENSRMVTLPTALGVDFRTNNIDFIDINGDGLPDVVDTSKSKHTFFLNELGLTKDLQQSTHDYPRSRMLQNPTETSAPLSNPSVQMLDYNGDGFTDLVDAVNKKIYVNRGNSKWEDASENLQSFPVTGTDPNMRFFDYNGDKAIDVISSDGNTTTYWIADGKGNWKVVSGQTNIGLGFAKDRLRLIDINGDGLQDIVHITKDAMRYRKYLGYGEWTDWIDVKVPGLDQYELNLNAQFNDINGDGMADMVAFLGNSIVYFVNKNGTEFSAGQRLQTFKGVDIPDSTKTTVRIADINGNGSRDIVWIDSSGKVTYLELFGKRPNLMTEISNGIGQRINVAYGSSAYFYLRDATCDKTKEAACAGPWQNKMPMPFTVVTQITTWASRSAQPATQGQPTPDERPQIQRVYYHDGFYDGNEKKFRGFRHVETIYDGDVSVKTRKDEIKYDVGDTDPHRHGRLLERNISDDQGYRYQSLQIEWGDCPVALGSIDAKQLTPPVRFLCTKSQEITYIEGETDPSKWRTTRTERQYDGYGNVTLDANFGEKGKDGDERYTKKVFLTPSDPNDPLVLWMPRALQQVYRCDAPPEGNTRCAETRYYYDGEAFKGLPLGQIRKGNLSRLEVRRSADPEDWVTPMRRQYDRHGNVIAYKGFTDALRTVEWDDIYHRFAVKESAQLEQVTLTASTQWDYALSKVTQSTDYNGNVTAYTYDTFGRLLTIALPNDDATTPSIRYHYEEKAPISRIVHERRSKVGGSFDRKQILCFDGLGRQLQTRQSLKEGRFLVYTHVEYNRLNHRARLWRSYESDEACTFAAPEGTPVSSTSYDGMGRIIERTNEDNTTSRTTYLPFQRQHYDEEDNHPSSPHANTPKIQHYDGLGRIIKEIESPAQNKEITTQFAYTAVNAEGMDKITRVTFDGGSQKQHIYDLFGNLTELIDPDRKSFRYQYNEANLLAKRTDGREIELHYTYDALGRLLTLQAKDQPNTQITYHYDLPQKELPEAAQLKGQTAKIAYPGGAYLFSYNKHALPALERHIVLGVPFDFQHVYDNTNKLTTQTMPDGRRFAFQHDGAGRITSVEGVLTTLTYAPHGPLQTWEGVNGVRTSYTLDQRERITRIDVQGKENVFSMDYTLDRVGNVTELAQSHGAQSFKERYRYDALYRLTQADLLDGKEILSYQQDNLHNIIEKTSSLQEKSPVHIGRYTYGSARIHQATQIGSMAAMYDEAGHTIQQGTQTLRWDHLGRCVEIQREGTPLQRAWYDGSPRRIIKEEHGLHTFYIHRDFVVRNGMGVSSLRLGRDRVVTVRSSRIAAQFFDDIAGDQADGKITAGDAWRYLAAKKGIEKATLKPRPLDLDLTRDMLQASVSRMLSDEKDSVQYHHVDHVGNIRAVTQGDGTVIERKHYYPYGKIREQQGSATTYAYMGAEYDPATETHRFLLRSFDPKSGRWLRPDPSFDQIGGADDEWNSYGLVSNNPLRFREIGGAMAQDTVTHLLPDDPAGQAAVLGVAALGMVAYGAYTVHSTKRFVNNAQGAGLTGYKSTNQVLNAVSLASTALFAVSIAASTMYGNEDIGSSLGIASLAFSAIYEGGNLWMLSTHQKELHQSGRHSRSIQRAKGLRMITTVGYVGLAAARELGAMEDRTGFIAGIAASAVLLGTSMIADRLHARGMTRKNLGAQPRRASTTNVSVESFAAGVTLPAAAMRRKSSRSSRPSIRRRR